MAGKSRSWEKAKLLDEGAVQMWVYELLCTGDQRTRKKILGRHEKPIKVVIPEFQLPQTAKTKTGHNTDFRVVFKDGSTLNIEVEWQVGKFSSHGKEIYDVYYSSDKGIIVALEDDEKLSYIDRKKNVVILSPNEFSFWFSKRARSIINTTISNKLIGFSARNRKIWVLGLATSGKKDGNSKEDYLKRGRPKMRGNGCWAFRYTNYTEAMRNILEIKSGDCILFMYGFEGHRGREFVARMYDWTFEGYDLLRIKDGYHVDIKDASFEKNWNPNDIEKKEYMHYFTFEYPPKPNKDYPELISKSDERMPLLEKKGKKKLEHWPEFCRKLSLSMNWHGAPIEISEDELSHFLTACREEKI